MLKRAFNFILEPSGTDKNLGLYRLFLLAVAMICVATVVFIVVQWRKDFSDTDTYARLGQVGDFFGGVLNPLLTFLTFIGVLATIFLQREDLKETRVEVSRQADALETQLGAIAKQNFEATLFQMLSLHNSNVNELRGQDGNYKPISGRAVISTYVTDLSSVYGNGRAWGHDPSDLNEWPGIYVHFWSIHRNALGHYFRLLYNMIRFVDTKAPLSANDANGKTQMEYMRIIRAQISDAELVMIFYNCCSKHGERLIQYAMKYDLFNNLDRNLLFNERHKEKLDEIRLKAGQDIERSVA
jgi:hypothetical protein